MIKSVIKSKFHESRCHLKQLNKLLDGCCGANVRKVVEPTQLV